ncbi:3-ketoacyl-CoA synthase 5-like [Amaranthus tricolor]|uniref:3-ketoacyl-CoA synthase 5-like n=1 Tax=Amaranthus tricolor TaxID=29722 RepID=UPI0025826B14|nr:3-ketoacyl-CoA synthase 5-like [Amaranthus tricolor]
MFHHLSNIFISLFIPFQKLNYLQILYFSSLIIFIFIIHYISRPHTVYLVDYSNYRPPTILRVPFPSFVEHSRIIVDDNKIVDFQMKILGRSGLGDETCLPPAIHYIPPNPTTDAAHEEAKTIIFSCLDKLFSNTGLKPKDVDILILNCGLFSPTPSLCATLVNKYKLRSDIASYNISGMGCSAGLISVDLAKDLLQIHPNSNAVIVSTEILTPNYYQGSDRAMLLPNCLFRMGGAAVLLSNKTTCRSHAKYQLLHLVRTHKGSDNKSFKCITRVEDNKGKLGISLQKDVMTIAREALKSNITTIGPLVLPTSEKILFLLSFFVRKPYVPDFKKAFEHFCIHVGGRAVIDELQKNLRLSDEHVEASRMTLHRFENTSSSSLWYELAYIEAKGMMKKGDRVWQIGLGSGFKCNSAVWKCLNGVTNSPTKDSPWFDCIHKYPVHIPEVVKL